MAERKTLRLLDCFTVGELAAIVAIAVASALTAGALLLILRDVLQVLNNVTVGDSGLALVRPLLTLTLMAAVYAVLQGLEFAVPEAISYRAVHRLRMAAYLHMVAMAPQQIQHRSRGSLILRLTGDLTMLRTWLSRGLSRAFVGMLSVIACLGVIASYSILIAMEIAASFAIATLLTLSLGRNLERLTRSVRRRRSLLTSNIDEQVNTLAVVQAFGRSMGESARLSQQSEKLTQTLVREARMRGLLRAIATGAGWLATIMVLVSGTVELRSGSLDLGSVVTALIAVRIMQGYVRSMGQAHEYWRRGEVSRAKLEDFLNSSSRKLVDPGLARLESNRARIKFEEVCVEGALNSFSAEVLAGRHVAIVGPSGSGKSTILRAIAQLDAVNAGRIMIGNQDLGSCQIASIQRKIGIVSPDLPLMRGTILRNLTYRKPSASREELDLLVALCKLDDVIETLPDGLEHWVTEGGLNLPTGLRQRIQLARAMLGWPPILLLDEAATLLDPLNRSIVRDVIAHYSGTILNVTCDPEFIATADTVWTIEDGALVREETSAEYLETVQGRQRRATRLALAG